MAPIFMSQFDSRAEAARSRLEAEERSRQLPAAIADPVKKLIEFLLTHVRMGNPQLDGAKDVAIESLGQIVRAHSVESVRYLLDCVCDDVNEIFGDVESLDSRLADVEQQLRSERFSHLLSQAAFQATRASSKQRIKRLSQVVVSGTSAYPNDPMDQVLEFERHAVELGDNDIAMLVLINKHQPVPARGVFREDQWIDEVRQNWEKMLKSDGYGAASARDARSSFARLQARGLITQISAVSTVNSKGAEPYALLDEGRLLLRYLRNA